jgi:hypothetical protein
VADTNAGLDRLLMRQHGLVTRAQLLAAGVTDSHVRAHLRARRWQRLTAGLYVSFTGRLGPGHRMIGACLHVGPGSQVSGAAALRWHGLRYAPVVDDVAVLAPAACRRYSVPGLARVVQTSRPDRREHRHGAVTVVSVARAVADSAREMRSPRAVRALVAEAVQRGLTTVPQLVAEVEDGRRNGSAHLRRAVAEVADGTRSAPEAELRALLSRSTRLPTILWNPHLRLPDGTTLRPDGWIAESAIALEVDSREYHLGPEDWERTMCRHNTLAAADALTLHISPARLRSEAPAVLDLVERAHLSRANRSRTPALPVITTRFSA